MLVLAHRIGLIKSMSSALYCTANGVEVEINPETSLVPRVLGMGNDEPAANQKLHKK
jgi:hypothetical protein